MSLDIIRGDAAPAPGGEGVFSEPTDLARHQTGRLARRLIEAAGGPGACAVLPAEIVRLDAVDLPLRTDRQRRQALPFALEDQLSVPLGKVEVALCRRLAPNRYLAASVDHDLLTEAHAGLPGRRLLPEQFAIPRPPPKESDAKLPQLPDARWAAHRDADRVVVRVSDGTGFCVRADMLARLWVRAGRPEVTCFGEPLPDGLAWTAAAELAPPDAEDLGEDLRQGVFAPPAAYRKPLRVAAAALPVVALLHVALAQAGLQAERAVSQEVRAQAAAALADHVPQASVQDDPGALYRQLTASGSGSTSRFVPLFEQASGALLGHAGQIDVDRLRWSAASGALTIAVTASELDVLQAAEGAMRNAGLIVDVGTATAGPEGAQAELTLRETGR